jgi:hypothetical protein
VQGRQRPPKVGGGKPRTTSTAPTASKNDNTGNDDDTDEQWIRATTTIEPGQEITISYLPIEFLYAETSFRQTMLRSTK